MKMLSGCGCSMVGCVVASVLVCAGVFAQPVPVTNPLFALGEDSPEGWRLSGDVGGWTPDAAVGDRAVYVTGEANSQASTAWHSEPISFEADGVYRLRVQARRVDGSGGSPIIGPTFANRDLRSVTSEWQQYTAYFVAPSVDAAAPLRLGQWNVGGTIAYDDVSLTRVAPVYRSCDGLTLGDGERIEGSRYIFTAPFAGDSANHARPLTGYDCFFNKPRWVFSEGKWALYTHVVDDVAQTGAAIEATIGHHTGGALVVEASADDGETWEAVGRLEDVGALEASLPATLFPADGIMVRFTVAPSEQAPDTPIGLQLYGYAYRADLIRAPGDFEGATRFIAVLESDSAVRLTFDGLGETIPGGVNDLRFQATNLTHEPLVIAPRLHISANDGAGYTATVPSLTLPPLTEDGAEQATSVTMPYDIPGAGDVVLRFELDDHLSYRAEATFTVPFLYETGYGALLPDTSEDVALWWASSGWKVSRARPAPREQSAAMRIQAARNEREAAQFVLRPAEALRNLRVTPQPLQGDKGATLPADAIETLLVGYVPVTQPTDYLGAAASWPDPLPPLDEPIALAADENQPVWVRARIGRDVPADVYRGDILLEADGWRAVVPLEVEVFDFTLPDRKTCVTAFGFNATLAFRYHNVDTEEDRRAVYDSYLSLLSDNHISVYTPTFLDPIVYSWPHLSRWRGGERDITETRDGGASLLLRDTSETANVGAVYDDTLPIPEKGLRIAFDYKTEEPGHTFMVTLLYYDASGAWLRGRNNDIVVGGDGAWQRFDQVVDVFPDDARQFRLRLWATPYTEAGIHTGAVWFDAVEAHDAASDVVLIQDDFAPHSPDDVATLFVPEFDWSAWDAAMTRAYEKYHINSFRVRIPGLGGGTFHSRSEPSLLGYGEDTLEYQTAFTAWCQKVETRLREKGWLDDAYVYWFDEPAPDDYDFVMNGFRKLKDAAPGLNRMLTETIVPELIGGPNIWCPVSYNYDHDMAEQRRAAGEKIWWYVCTGPKAPYATLFIDHPGTAMRAWLWQTWERSIDGVLVWQTNYWTSDEAYPDAPQNPYEDPMAWVTSYGTPVGARRPWGNGDGRFVYPPVAAADGQPEAPVFDDPVSSIRLEMLRDGIEDYEYCVILRDLLEKHKERLSTEELKKYQKLLEVPDSITQSLTEFTWNPAPIEAHREAVASAVVALKKRP